MHGSLHSRPRGSPGKPPNQTSLPLGAAAAWTLLNRAQRATQQPCRWLGDWLQAAGTALRVSCATPVLGPVGGVLGVGFASALAGQAGIEWQQFVREGRSPLQEPLRGVRLEDMLLDAALGVAMFKVWG